jgi:hypothetical protein
MHLITRLTAALASFTLVGAVCGLPQRANSKEPGCVTWSEAKSEVHSLFNQSLRYERPLPELPNGFKNGCTFGNLGASTIAIYVLKDGLRPHSVQDDKTVFGTSIPQFAAVDVGSATIENGEVLVLHNVCGSTGTASFCEDIPVDRAYMKNGLVCLQNLCIQANSVPNTEVMRLWNATLKPVRR